MIGTYVAVSAALSYLKGLETSSHNLSNASTPGFKRLISQMNPVPVEGPGAAPGGVHLPVFTRLGEFFLDRSPGGLSATGQPLDLAIEGEGYFVVRTPQGDTLTRNGGFRLSTEGKLVTTEGFPVLDRNGRDITLPGHGRPTVQPSGEILLDGTPVGRLDIQTAEGQRLPEELCRVVQGHLENANVNPIEEMVKMIELSRGFGLQMKSIEGFSQLGEKLTNSLGRI